MVCCAYARKVDCVVVGSCYTSCQPCTAHQPMSRSRRFTKGVGHCRRTFHREGGVAHQPLLVLENWSDCPFVLYQIMGSASSSFVTIHTSNRRTDRIATAIGYRASHGKNCNPIVFKRMAAKERNTLSMSLLYPVAYTFTIR